MSDLFMECWPTFHPPSPLSNSGPILNIPFIQEAFQVPLSQSACPASDLSERERPQWGLPAWPPSLAAGELLGLPVGASLTRPKLDLVLRDLCPKRDSLGCASILGDKAGHQRGRNLQPRASVSTGKPAPP